MKIIKARQTHLLFVLLLNLSLVTGCGTKGETGKWLPDGPPPTVPTVILTVPANLATHVSTDTEISATFSEEMDPSTL
ncbi:MAG: Ig-like domain-containing protein, partial [Nitrospinae bacterium]|nr:Ig-like domain-containing protein [Nitrospinota bacterium]